MYQLHSYSVSHVHSCIDKTRTFKLWSWCTHQSYKQHYKCMCLYPWPHLGSHSCFIDTINTSVHCYSGMGSSPPWLQHFLWKKLSQVLCVNCCFVLCCVLVLSASVHACDIHIKLRIVAFHNNMPFWHPYIAISRSPTLHFLTWFPQMQMYTHIHTFMLARACTSGILTFCIWIDYMYAIVKGLLTLHC